MLNAPIYINGLGSVSAQGFDTAVLLDQLKPVQNVVSLIQEPNYSKYIDANNIRRMGKLIKASIVAAKSCIADAGSQPDAIITGTGLGCMEETVKFLNAVNDNEGGVLSPTPFIHSTHNTIGSQIAIAVKCMGYNSTYVHRALSFEQALFDAQLQLLSHINKVQHILVGGVDDMTPIVFDVLNELGFWKSEFPTNSLIGSKSKGSVAGEGMNFLMLSSQYLPSSYARLAGIKICYKPNNPNEIADALRIFLLENNINESQIDLVLLGDNGDINFSQYYQDITHALGTGVAIGYFKHLCGEYFTASAFGLVLAALMLKNQHVPAVVCDHYIGSKPLKNIVIYNQSQGDHHSFSLVQHV